MFRWLIPIIYVVAVLICLLIAFDFDGRMRSSTAWLIAVVLTLPWSLFSVLFIWALIHGAGLELFTGLYLLFALLNGYVLHRLLRAKRESWRRFFYGKYNNLDGNERR